MSKNNISDLIPAGTIAKVKMTIKPGGYNDLQRGWTNNYATHNTLTGSVYLNVKFTVLYGKYVGKNIFGRIGLYSGISEYWSKMGSTFVRSILSSARGVSFFDNSIKAKNLCTITSFAEIDGLEFPALINVEDDKDGNARNVIYRAITTDHKDYELFMGKSKNTIEG